MRFFHRLLFNSVLLCLCFLVACEKDSLDEAVIVVSFAGNDTVLYDTTSLHLYAKEPKTGRGEWRIVSGSGGNIVNLYDPHTRFDGLLGESYQLCWQVYVNASVYRDTVRISFLEGIKPPIAYAGNDRIVTDTLEVQLQANLPHATQGTWLLVEGSGSFQNIHDPHSLFYAESFGSYILQWKLLNVEGADSATVSITFEESGPPSFVCGDVFVDPRDGKSYQTVEIKGVCWMAENLNYGEMIPDTTTQTNNDIVEKYCYNNLTSNCDAHGGLYQWNEMMDYTTMVGTQGICPAGWRVSTDQDWMTAEMALGMSESQALLNNTWRGTDQGTKMKEGGSSGLEVKMAGRHVSGSFWGMHGMAYIWTSNELGNEAYRRCFSSTASDIGRYTSFGKYAAFSVRCVKE